MKALVYLGIISISFLHADDLFSGSSNRGGPLSLFMQAQQPHEEAGSKENIGTSNPFAHAESKGIESTVIADPVDKIFGVTNRENIGSLANATVPDEVRNELETEESIEELRHGVLSGLDPDGAKSDLDLELFNPNPLDDDLRNAKIA